MNNKRIEIVVHDGMHPARRLMLTLIAVAVAVAAILYAIHSPTAVRAEGSHTDSPAEEVGHWEYSFDGDYWIERGKRQGVYGDPLNITDTIYGIERGREIYDPESDAWYWLDACRGGARARNKEVWFPYVFQGERPGSTQGKWCLYDGAGGMVKYIAVSIEPDYDEMYMPIPGTYRKRIRFYHPITGALMKGTVRLHDLYQLTGEDADGDGEDDGVIRIEFVTDLVYGRADLDVNLIDELGTLTTGEWPVYDIDHHKHYTLTEYLAKLDEPKIRDGGEPWPGEEANP
jgi:hypothetical protein